MTARIYISGIIGKDVRLLDIIRQVNSYSKVSEVEVEINSVGGEVNEGKAIYNYLRSLNKPIRTIAKEKVYSIASYIFLAGDERIATKDGSNQFLIHLPWSSVTGNSQKLDEVSSILKEIEKDFTQFYSKYTKLDENSVMKLLQDETYMTADEAFDLNIVTNLEMPFQACAMLEKEFNKSKKENLMTKAEKFMKAFGEFLDGSVKSTTEEVEVQNLVVQDATGAELTFPELEESEAPEKGDKVMKDGQAIVDATFTMPDGSKIVVKESVVEEVIAAPEQEEEQQEEEEIAEAKTSENPEAKKEDSKEEESKAEETEEKKEEEVDYLALLTDVEKKITEKIEAKYEEREKALKAEINALKKEIGSSIENEPSNKNKNFPKSGNSLTNALRRR